MRTRERDHVRIMRTRERYLAKMLAKCSTSHFFRPRKFSARRSDRGCTDGASWIRAGCAVGWSRSRYRANPVTQIATLSSKSCHTNCYQICSISSIEQICSKFHQIRSKFDRHAHSCSKCYRFCSRFRPPRSGIPKLLEFRRKPGSNFMIEFLDRIS